MTVLLAEAEVRLAAPEPCLRLMCAHFAEHEYAVTSDGRLHRIAFPAGRGTLEVGPGRLRLRAEADDAGALHLIRLSLASHLLEFTPGERPDITWNGDLSGIRVPPNFREVAVRSVRDLTPAMRRVTLAGADLARFDAFDLHLKLLLPAPGREPCWPSVGPSGLLVWPEGDDRPAMRTYTIRRIDAASGEIDVDMVVHPDHPGPGSAFASRARPGDRIGIIGPGGRNVLPAEWVLLAGDETALPAIARVLAALPRTTRGVAIIEVAVAGERQPLPAPPGMSIRWLERDGRPAGTTTGLLDAVRSVDVPEGDTIFTWAGAEFATAQAIRQHWRRPGGVPRDRQLCVSYWRRGIAQGSAAASR